MTQSKCPVCEGRGWVPGGFYAADREEKAQTCRSCGGRGHVTVEEAVKVGAERDPMDLTFDGD